MKSLFLLRYMDPKAYCIGDVKTMSFNSCLRLRLDANVSQRPDREEEEDLEVMPEANMEKIVEKRVIKIAPIIRTFPFGFNSTTYNDEDPLRRLLKQTPGTEFYDVWQ